MQHRGLDARDFFGGDCILATVSLRCGAHVLALDRPRVMGVINVTPDSFSDGGRYLDLEAARVQARRLAEEGADLLDVGGESTRPGAARVGVQEELDRVVPVIEAIRAELNLPISIDTSKPEVMREAVSAGAGMINDVRALRHPGALEAARELGVPVCLMHMLGEPGTMQTDPSYSDVVVDVHAFLEQRVQVCRDVGIPREQLLVDPGFGFGKTLSHNLSLLRHLRHFTDLGLPVVAGLSRKSMIGAILDAAVDERLYGSLTAAVIAALNGASILRVHDVGPTVQAVKVVAAVNAAV
jgi:dihydropteroate synthase